MVVDVGKVVEDHPRAKGRVPCVVAKRWNWRFLLARTLSLLESLIFFPESPTLQAWKGLGRNWFVEHCGFSFPLEPFFLGSIVYRSYARWSPVQGEAITGDEHFSWLLLQGGSGKEPLKSSVTRNFIKKKNLQTDGTQVRPKEDLPIQLDQANVKVERFPIVRQPLRVNLNGNLSFQITSNLPKRFFPHRFIAQTSCDFLKALLLMTYSKTDMKFPLCPVNIVAISKSQHFHTAPHSKKEGFLDIIGD